ncbi:hypothetical protein EV361DRAFT_956439 [Lentinula raphanica]|nr:hypothetical protein EV361DRAFT_956439 [Lentinula raphanica]
MSFAVSSTALVPSSTALVDPSTDLENDNAQFCAALDSLARANFKRVTAPGRNLKGEDIRRIHHNPETGKFWTILNRRMAQAMWAALLTAYNKLICKADLGRSNTAFVSEESLCQVSLCQLPLDWIVENLTDPNPLLYLGTEAECQMKASNLEAAGVQLGWD